MSRIDLRQARRSLAIAGSIAVIAAQTLIGSASAAPSTVVKVDGTQLFCPFDTPAAGGTLFAITRDRSDGGSFAFVDLFIEPSDPAVPVLSGGMDDPPLTSTGYHGSFDVAIDETGEVVGSATIDATFTGTGAFRARRVYQDSVQKGIFEDLLVSGSLTVATTAGNYQFDLAGCQADSQDRMDQAHHPSGPKPGETAPGNDTPAGAMPLTVGSQIQEWTGGAAIDAEATCVMGTGDDAFEFGIGRTVWFSVAGNGGSITVDPGGSDFDTVVAAYAVDGNALDQVGCVDDDRAGHAQGSVTFDSTVGTTYLIQVGGVIGQFDGDPEDPQWGRLRLHVE